MLERPYHSLKPRNEIQRPMNPKSPGTALDASVCEALSGETGRPFAGVGFMPAEIVAWGAASRCCGVVFVRAQIVRDAQPQALFGD